MPAAEAHPLNLSAILKGRAPKGFDHAFRYTRLTQDHPHRARVGCIVDLELVVQGFFRVVI